LVFFEILREPLRQRAAPQDSIDHGSFFGHFDSLIGIIHTCLPQFGDTASLAHRVATSVNDMANVREGPTSNWPVHGERVQIRREVKAPAVQERHQLGTGLEERRFTRLFPVHRKRSEVDAWP
jgi:hypothetical protein